MSRIFAYLVIGFLAILIIAAILIYLNFGTIKSFVSKTKGEFKSALSLAELIKKETGFKHVFVFFNPGSEKSKKVLSITINDDFGYSGDLEQLVEKVQLIAIENFPIEVDFIEVNYYRSFYLSKEDIKRLKRKQPLLAINLN